MIPTWAVEQFNALNGSGTAESRQQIEGVAAEVDQLMAQDGGKTREFVSKLGLTDAG